MRKTKLAQAQESIDPLTTQSASAPAPSPSAPPSPTNPAMPEPALDRVVTQREEAAPGSYFTQASLTNGVRIGSSILRNIIVGRDGISKIEWEGAAGIAVTFAPRGQPERTIVIPSPQIAYATKGPPPPGQAY